ncbi:hypothetical protein B566_EDAN014549, partial [Ephemera danica]
MSYDPQWRSFQPPPHHMNSNSPPTADSNMLNYKSQGPHTSPQSEYNNGGSYTNSTTTTTAYARPGYSSGRTQQPTPPSSNHSGSSGRFPIGTFSSNDSTAYNGDSHNSSSRNHNNSSSSSSAANSSYDSSSQSIRET